MDGASLDVIFFPLQNSALRHYIGLRAGIATQGPAVAASKVVNQPSAPWQTRSPAVAWTPPFHPSPRRTRKADLLRHQVRGDQLALAVIPSAAMGGFR